jgi:hypothetical protein
MCIIACCLLPVACCLLPVACCLIDFDLWPFSGFLPKITLMPIILSISGESYNWGNKACCFAIKRVYLK